jgi:alkane 1-monooxygenase
MSLRKKLGFLHAFLLPLFVVIGYYAGGGWNFLTLVVVYGVFPVQDYFMGLDSENPKPEDEKALSDDRYFRFVTYAWVYVQVALLGWAAWAVAVGTWTVWTAGAFLAGVATVTGGIGITVAHELGHRTDWLEKLYAQVLLVSVGYGHFFIEHNQGHHVWVATPRDPATSRKGENFYAFWWRTVTGSWLSAWRLEAGNLRKKGLSLWSSQNRMLWYAALPVLFAATLTVGVYAVTGSEAALWRVPLFFVAQSVGAFTLLELVNYIEHYGMVRREVTPGRYERVNPLHSWNANPLLSNFYLFQLQRHADHHAHANRRYQILRHFDESPQLPAGYPTMVQVALVPPLWFRLMNPRLESWQREQANR